MRANRIMAGLCVLMGMACGDDGGSGPPPGDPPVVTSLSTTSAAPGETITITGSNFAATEALVAAEEIAEEVSAGADSELGFALARLQRVGQ